MQRREFLNVSTAALAAGFFLTSEESAAGQPAAEAKGPKVLASPPVLQNPSADGMTVVVAVDTISTAWVEYGPTPQLGSRADDSRHGLLPLNGRVHRIRMTGLKPGTRYHYRIVACPIDFKGAYRIHRGKAVASEVFTFRTLDQGNTGVTSFAVINDTHENLETLKGLSQRMEAAKAEMTFWNGDVFNDVRTDEQVVNQVLRFGSGAPFAASSPLCFVSGNHDVRGIHARSLERFVDVPGDRRHYVLRSGPVAFVVLDTGEDKLDTHAVYAGLNDFARYRDEQRRWLEQAVKSEEFRSAPFRVAIMHIPLWGGGSSEDSRTKWHAILDGAGVQAVINGHIHKTSCTPSGGDHGYAQLVGGGPAPDSATFIEGRADSHQLSLIVRDLSGKEVGNYGFKA